MANPVYCSFCGKSQHEVLQLIAGPGFVYICNEYVALCTKVLSEGMASYRCEYKFLCEIGENS